MTADITYVSQYTAKWRWVESFALMTDELALCHQIVAFCTVNCKGLIVLFSLIWFRIVKHDGHMTTGTQSLP